MIVNLLILLFVVLNIVDTFITLYSIKVGLHEKNPFINYITHKAGLLGLLVLKSIMIIVIILFSGWFAVESLLILNILYVLIVTNNLLKLYVHVEGNNDNND